MSQQPICQHCNQSIQASDHNCPHCGMPLAPNHGSLAVRTFIFWFVLIVLFCLIMILYLPPDWSRFLTR